MNSKRTPSVLLPVGMAKICWPLVTKTLELSVHDAARQVMIGRVDVPVPFALIVNGPLNAVSDDRNVTPSVGAKKFISKTPE